MASKNPSENLSSFSVDDGTASDLQLQSVILAGFFQYLHSERARQHLAEIVTQPCLDVNRIRKRYDAIVALSEDPNLQAIILEIGQFEESLYCFREDEPRQRISETLATLKRDSVPSIILRILIGSWLVAGRWGLALAMFLYTFSIPANEMFVAQRLRRQLKASKDLMRSVGQFAELLVASKSELLRDYGRSLQQSPLYPDTPDFKRLKRALQPGLWSRILDFFLGYSRFSLQNLTERVLGRFEADYEQVLKIITDIDILQSNVMSMQDGYTIATLLEDGPPRLQIVKGHHPFLHRKSPVHSVPNDLDLEVSPSSQRRFAILTGPNAGGKSTYLRMVAGNVLLALSGNLVPAESMELTPMLVFTNMRVMDSVEDSESFFYAQAKRIKCLDEATKIHDPCLVVFDEIGTGTGSREKQALERTLIARLLARRVACLVATHEQSLAHIAENTPGMFNLRVASRDTEEYRVLPGIAVSSEAGKVLAEVGLDLDFLREYENQLAIIQGSTIQGSTIQGDSCFADG